MNDPRTDPQDIIVKPGQQVLISITLPGEFPEEESCAAGIILEDFLASRSDLDWRPYVHSVLQKP